jgi:ribosomal protein S18 acetylase RimI-like enzyme
MAEIRRTTEGDFDGVFDLLDARSRAAFGISELQREWLRHSWNLAESWVADDGGAIVSYAALTSAGELSHSAADPEVGDALLERVLEHAHQEGFRHLKVTVVPQDKPLSALVKRHAFSHDRDILRMWRSLNGDLPAPRWPGGVAVRSYTDSDAERVHALLDEAYAGWDPDYVKRPHADWLAFMTAHDDFDPAMWFLVERDGGLVACALHWKEFQQRGWVKDIVVREDERGNGLGKALLHHAFREYAERGATRVGLKVDSTNPTGAPRLYERVGFVTDQRYGIWIKRL